MKLTNDQWQIVEALIPSRARDVGRRGGEQGRGRPLADLRAAANTVLTIGLTGKRFADFSNRNSAFRRYSEWKADGTLGRIQKALDLPSLNFRVGVRLGSKNRRRNSN